MIMFNKLPEEAENEHHSPICESESGMNEYFRFYNDTPQRGFYAPKCQISFNLIYSILIFFFSQIITISDRKNS